MENSPQLPANPLWSGHPSSLCLLDSEGGILHVNQAWRTFALENGGDIARVCEGANYLQACASAPEAADFVEGLLGVLQGKLTVFEWPYPCHSPEEERYFLVRVLAIEGHARIKAVVIHENVTLQRHHQTRIDQSMGLLLRYAQCAIWSGTVRYLGDVKFDWQVRFSDEEAAERLFPIVHHPDKTFFESWYLARPPEDRDRSDRLGKSQVRAGKDYSNLFRCQLQNGQTRWVKEDVTVTLLEQDLWQVVGVCTDITAQKQAEQDFQNLMTGARCLLWNATVISAPEPGREWELHWEIAVSNEVAAASFFPVAQLPRQSYTDAWLASRIEEDWSELHRRSSLEIRAGRGYSQEFRCRTHDGSILWIKEDVQVEHVKEGQWRAVGVCTDITDIKAKEEALQSQEHHLRLALKGGSLSSWLVDVEQGQLQRYSPELPTLFGFDEAEAFTWDDFIRAVLPEDRRRVFQAIAKAIQSQESTTVEYCILSRDGQTRWLESHGQAVLGTSQAVLGAGSLPTQIIGVTRDITDRKRAEQAQEQALKEAKERADRDPLTGLLNHRAFYKRLEEEWARAEREQTQLALVLLDLDNFKFFNDVYGHTTGDEVIRQVAEKLRASCRVYDSLARFGGDEFAILMPGVGHSPGVDTRSVAEIELRIKNQLDIAFQPPGYPNPIPITASLGVALSAGTREARASSGREADNLHPGHELVALADERLRRAKSGGGSEGLADQTRQRASQAVEGFTMLDGLVAAVDNKDRYTKRHSEDVMAYCLQIARQLDLPLEVLHTIAVAALLHDVGKIGVPDAILRKPGKLSDAEFDAVKLHPTMGAAIVGAVAGLEYTLDAVRHHHERWDGLGYPDGLAGEAIPWMARLMAVADAFSAMTTDRPYRQGMSPARARAILEEGTGTQWDPQYVSAFLATGPKDPPDLIGDPRD